LIAVGESRLLGSGLAARHTPVSPQQPRYHETQASSHLERNVHESKYTRLRNPDYQPSIRQPVVEPANSRNYMYERTTVIGGDQSSPVKTTTIIESRGAASNQPIIREEREFTSYTRTTPNASENMIRQRQYVDRSGSKERAFTPTKSYTRQAERRDELEASANRHLVASPKDRERERAERRERYGLSSNNLREEKFVHQQLDGGQLTGSRTTELAYSVIKERSPTGNVSSKK
jgi:hypothetical protein